MAMSACDARWPRQSTSTLAASLSIFTSPCSMSAPCALSLMSGAPADPEILPRACSVPRASSASRPRLSASMLNSRSSVRLGPRLPSMARAVVPARSRTESKVQSSPCLITCPAPLAEFPRNRPDRLLNATSRLSLPKGAPLAFRLKLSAPLKPGRSVPGLNSLTGPSSAQLCSGLQRALPASSALPPNAPSSSSSICR